MDSQTDDKSEKVVILGASDKPERYSYKAYKMLTEHGHHCLLVHPTLDEVSGVKCFHSLSDISNTGESIDTLTMYLRAEISSAQIQEILDLKPKRVIFNPGTENHELYQSLKMAGISFEEACTLVLLSTGQY